MSQTTTPSGADKPLPVLLVPVGDMIAKLHDDAAWETYIRAYRAITALIDRKAELEAQTPSALREKLRSCEEALQAVEADRDALVGERDALRNDLENAWAEADALRS